MYDYNNGYYSGINPDLPGHDEKKKLRKAFNSIGIVLLCSYFLMDFAGEFGFYVLYRLNIGGVFNDNNIRVIQAGELFVMGCTPAFCSLIIFFAYHLIKKERVSSLFKTKNVNRSIILKFVILSLFCQEISSILQIILLNILTANNLEVVFFNFLLSPDAATTFWELFSSIILAPVAEELFFRGIILKKAAKISQTFAIFFTSLIFGLMHSNPYQLIGGFLMGIPLAYVTIKTGSLIPAIICHMAVNLNASSSMLLSGFSAKFQNSFSFYSAILILLVGGVLFFALKKDGELKLPRFDEYHKKRTLPIAATSWSLIVVTVFYVIDIIRSVGVIPPEIPEGVLEDVQEIFIFLTG